MPETWDCFFFNDELDLLEFRLAELDAVIDRVIVVESTRTFSGLDKGLVLTANLKRFSKWADKLTVVTVELDPDAPSPWLREAQQRAALRRAVEQGRGDDLLIVGDVDEIPDPDVIVQMRDEYTGPARLGMAHAIYHANWVVRTEWLEGPFVTRRSDIGAPGVRDLLNDTSGGKQELSAPFERVVHAAGYHLSSLGGMERLLSKLNAYSHQELNSSLDRSVAHLRRCYRFGVHLSGLDVVRRLGVNELDPMLKRLMAKRPEFFDFTPSPPTWRVRAYAGYTWARRSGRLPQALVDLVDRHELLATGLAAPFTLALDTARRIRRRWRERSQAIGSAA